jgi:hypothetical protein
MRLWLICLGGSFVEAGATELINKSAVDQDADDAYVKRYL